MNRSASASSRPPTKSSPTDVSRLPSPAKSSRGRVCVLARVDERAVDEVVDADRLLAADEQLRLAGAVGRDRVEVDVAAVLDREDDAVAVPDAARGASGYGAHCRSSEAVRTRRSLPSARMTRDLAVMRIRAVLGRVDRRR